MSSRGSLHTRFAPSPTGGFHLGHALHMIWVWGSADLVGAELLIRIEDHDQSRCRPAYFEAMLSDLKWLKLKARPESQLVTVQSARHEIYQKEFDVLSSQGVLYTCRCSRKDILSQTEQGGGALHYPGTCRSAGYPMGEPDSVIRLRMPDSSFSFSDICLGPQIQNPAEQCGDIVIKDRQGQWTYQFCVVIDDLRQNINFVVRGEDLLSSVGRQLALRSLLNPSTDDNGVPLYLHHPLIRNSSGDKLSKRLGSETLNSLREAGRTPASIFGLAAFLGGLIPTEQDVWPDEFKHILPSPIKDKLLCRETT